MRAVLLPLCQLFATQWTIAQQASLSMGFSRQDYRSGLPCPPPDLLNPGIKPMSPALADMFFITSATWEYLGALKWLIWVLMWPPQSKLFLQCLLGNC